MNIQTSYSSTVAQLSYAGFSQSAGSLPRTPHEEHDHHRIDKDDHVSLSTAARQAQRVRTESDEGEDNPLSALDKLAGKLLKAMMKVFTGREFNLLQPSAAQPAAAGQSTVPAAVDATGSAPAPATSPTGNALAAYAQVQSFSLSFSASATVNTEDGQQVGVSVQFSYSEQFYAAAAVSGGAGTSGSPVTADFEGVAAQLTQTSFNFELDFDGQPQQQSTIPPAGETAPATASASPAPTAPATTTVETDENPLFKELDKLFQRLQVWARHQDGSRSLIAVGLNSSSAVYVGQLASATAAATPATEPTGGPAVNADQKNQAVDMVA